MKYINDFIMKTLSDFLSFNLQNIKINSFYIKNIPKKEIKKYKKEILSNRIISEYLIKIDKFHVLNPTEDEILKINSPLICYDYAHSVIGGPFPQGEPIILTDPKYSYYYAKYIIRGAWKSAEDTINKNPAYSTLYAKSIINGPWEPGESIIMSSPEDKEDYLSFLEKKVITYHF